MVGYPCVQCNLLKPKINSEMQCLKLSGLFPLHLEYFHPWPWPSTSSYMILCLLPPSSTLLLPGHISVLSVSQNSPFHSCPKPLYLLSLLPRRFFVWHAFLHLSNCRKLSPLLTSISEVLPSQLSCHWSYHVSHHLHCLHHYLVSCYTSIVMHPSLNWCEVYSGQRHLPFPIVSPLSGADSHRR